MTPSDAEKLKSLLVRALRDGSAEGEGAMRAARQIVERSMDFRPEDSIAVMSAGETGKWLQNQRLLAVVDERVRTARRYSTALENELETILSPALLEKVKRKAAKVAQTPQEA